MREDKDLNQADVAKIIGTTQQYYGQYEAGKRPIPLAKYYNVSIDYIAGLTNDKGGLHNNSKYNITQQNNNSAVIKIKEK